MAKSFTVDARAMLTWGRESIKDRTTAVLELVKNSYDANASVVDIVIRSKGDDASTFIAISDDGTGMSAEDVESSWLRLGFSSKRTQKFTARGRRRTGEKGIGRISADRLGRFLDLRSQALDQRPTGLKLDWDAFEQPGLDLTDVPVIEITDVVFDVPRPSPWNVDLEAYGDPPKAEPNSTSHSGTQLLIRELRQRWDADDIAELRRLLSVLTPPFREISDFQVRLDTDVAAGGNGVVTPPDVQTAAIEADFSLDSSGIVRGALIHREHGSDNRSHKSVEVPFAQFIHPKQGVPLIGTTPDVGKELGSVRTRLFFYPQRAETVRGLGLDLSDLRSYLQTNAGVRVYRDGIRVPPYGDQGRPEGDWLWLGDRKARNPAGANRSDFRVSPYQLVGAVFIGRDSNPSLIDTSGREGLVAGRALTLLKAFILGALTLLESHYHGLFQAEMASSKAQTNPRETVEELRGTLSQLSATVKAAERSLPPTIADSLRLVVKQAAAKLETAERSMEELASQAVVSRALATIGIAAATFGHETQSGLDSMKASLNVAQLLVNNRGAYEAIAREVAKAIREADKVSTWGGFALGRVKRDKRIRKLIDVSKLLQGVATEIEPAFRASSIAFKSELAPIRAHAFPVDIECVAINLLANAYFFTKRSSVARQVLLALKPSTRQDKAGFSIIVSDSGPGVSEENRARVWDPLFTTKLDRDGRPIGTGLGLALVHAIVQDVNGERTVDADPALRGARFTVWFPER